MTQIDAKQVAGSIDHTLLKAEATQADIEQLCDEAIKYGFCSVCVHPRWVEFAAERIQGTGVKVDGVVGFPFGADLTRIKAIEARELIFAGADEVDMVADLAAVKAGDANYLAKDFGAVLNVCRDMRPVVILKVIIESAALNEEEKKFVCQVASDCGVDFVKTSTGLHPAGGATIEDVKLMKKFATNCKVKAAGGIRTAEQAIAMLEAGAQRIGTSASVAIVQELGL